MLRVNLEISSNGSLLINKDVLSTKLPRKEDWIISTYARKMVKYIHRERLDLMGSELIFKVKVLEKEEQEPYYIVYSNKEIDEIYATMRENKLR